jgi:hypothetical protein
MPVWNGLTQFGSFLGQRFSPRSELNYTRVRIALLIEDCGHMWSTIQFQATIYTLENRLDFSSSILIMFKFSIQSQIRVETHSSKEIIIGCRSRITSHVLIASCIGEFIRIITGCRSEMGFHNLGNS